MMMRTTDIGARGEGKFQIGWILIQLLFGFQLRIPIQDKHLEIGKDREIGSCFFLWTTGKV
eukprot:CAMPEP_0170895068 /NCGR_PEP_ID=MMETSP0734-20130129/43665_1 /TAXON_ID=186038 /ORGANISM="Fragilariopsis kerguelensis, Strain L26-C5" /LENGTH=60 /DNA_ID=CAMNT_0011286421 /DNA_START=26 /DNA_END=208 /DNA_ORIENTATION=+